MEGASDTGSTPVWFSICGKEGPSVLGGFLITYADAYPNLFGFKCVCSIKCNASEGGIAYIVSVIQAQWLSWLERRPVTAEVTGSSPVWVV